MLGRFGARYYSPSIGRFINKDPIGLAGGLNMYAYVGGNPINWIDPSGNIAIADDIAIGLLIFATGYVIVTTGWQTVGEAIQEAISFSNIQVLIFPRKSGHKEELVLA